MVPEATPPATETAPVVTPPASTETVVTTPASPAASTTETVGLDTRLPDEHPLVKTLATLKTKAATTATELAEARAQAAKVTKLEADLNARPTPEALTTLQTRYDRLESFLQGVGGPLSKALDSRTFTRDLFESDKPIGDLLKDWNKANPSATTTALSSSSASPASKAPTVNDLLRAAVNK